MNAYHRWETEEIYNDMSVKHNEPLLWFFIVLEQQMRCGIPQRILTFLGKDLFS